MRKLHFEHIEKDIALVQGIYLAFEVPPEARDFLWRAIATFCLYQLQEKKGDFYESAKERGLLGEPASIRKTPKRAKKANRPPPDRRPDPALDESIE